MGLMHLTGLGGVRDLDLAERDCLSAKQHAQGHLSAAFCLAAIGRYNDYYVNRISNLEAFKKASCGRLNRNRQSTSNTSLKQSTVTLSGAQRSRKICGRF